MLLVVVCYYYSLVAAAVVVKRISSFIVCSVGRSFIRSIACSLTLARSFRSCVCLNFCIYDIRLFQFIYFLHAIHTKSHQNHSHIHSVFKRKKSERTLECVCLCEMEREWEKHLKVECSCNKTSRSLLLLPLTLPPLNNCVSLCSVCVSFWTIHVAR